MAFVDMAHLALYIKKFQSALIIIVSGISFITISALDGALREVGVYNAWLDM
jgi:hypothetical protein